MPTEENNIDTALIKVSLAIDVDLFRKQVTTLVNLSSDRGRLNKEESDHLIGIISVCDVIQDTLPELKFSHGELIDIQFTQWPETIVTTPEKLKQYHNDQTILEVIDHYAENEPHSVFYILGKGSCVSGRCNGIRYGDDGDYVSLPNIPETVWEEVGKRQP